MAAAVIERQKTVGDPSAVYESLLPLWLKSRAVCGGQRKVKEHDKMVSTQNLLIPFSPTMSSAQYAFYKAEAELPGITAQFSRMIVGGLLRKPPMLTIPDSYAPDVLAWLTDEFSQDGMPLTSFLDEALWEELQTNSTWVLIDYPVEAPEDAEVRPYPVLLKAENVINFSTKKNDKGQVQLQRVIV